MNERTQIIRNYVEAERAFQQVVANHGSVAARIERPELARRVTETFTQFSKLGIPGQVIQGVYKIVREQVGLSE